MAALVPQVTFVDGDFVSSLPMYLFNDPRRTPLYPTFGVQLRSDINTPQDITDPISLFGAILLCSARQVLGRDPVQEGEDQRRIVTTIDASGFCWLDFAMSQATKVALFAAGARAAKDFLTGCAAAVRSGPVGTPGRCNVWCGMLLVKCSCMGSAGFLVCWATCIGNRAARFDLAHFEVCSD